MRHRLKVAASKGISLDSPPPPDGFKTKGVSTLYGPDGDVKAQWVKNYADAEKQQALMEETLSAFMEPLKGLAKPTKAPKSTASNLFTEYILTDLHLGQYSWAEETGDDWDINIADETARAAIDRLVASAPASERCLINQMGDFFHADGNVPATPTGNNILDTDTRHRKVMWVGIYLLRYAIHRALEKHKTVEIRNTVGNHDIHSSMPLDVACKCFFHNEPRVVVHDKPRTLWAYTFGANLVGVAHGHKLKVLELPGLLATDYATDWGTDEDQFRYVRHGHFHTQRSFEKMHVIVEGFRSLSANDAWHEASGYRSGREAVAIVLDEEYGEVERHTAGIKRILNDR